MISKPSAQETAVRRAEAEHHPARPELSLADKIVLVSGASTGIGRAIAVACAQAGADVAVAYATNQAGAEATADQVRAAGRRTEVLRADVSDAAGVAALAAGVRGAFGRADVWINNAGADILSQAAAGLSRVEKLDRLLAVDLRGSVLASWAAVELMQGQDTGGVILNMAWDHILGGGLKGEYPQLFSAAKGGVYSFSRALARTVAPHIRVNVIGPGWVETDYGARLDPAVKQRIADAIPLRRWGRPEDVAAAAVFLACDAAGYITGQMLMINGGDVL
jgi:3-oxoacyl-[acyl-carrier protein] reductase